MTGVAAGMGAGAAMGAAGAGAALAGVPPADLVAASPAPTLAALAVGATVFLGTLALGRALDPAAALPRRARALARTGAARPPARARLLALAERAGAAAARLPLQGAAERQALAQALGRAGFRSRGAVGLYLLARLLLPALLAGLGLALAALAGLEPAPLALALGALGVALPPLAVSSLGARRRRAMERGFPDALDLLVICVESGLSIDAAIARVAGELGRAHAVLGEELRHAAVELRFLPDRADAFANLEARTGIDGVRALVALLHQTERFGTPLADALRTLAAELRTAAFLRVEERAARLPAVLTVPMILFILPPLFIVLIGPVIAQLLAR